ncbi:hypothetical protein VTL71DRAFT_7474 [Oculimacula yallundae]|uniref:Uncharacterized protein n=1 Tax=Oculimacula yallundae TaxID=86028 RepID=A0ABR4BVR8_9HELO
MKSSFQVENVPHNCAGLDTLDLSFGSIEDKNKTIDIVITNPSSQKWAQKRPFVEGMAVLVSQNRASDHEDSNEESKPNSDTPSDEQPNSSNQSFLQLPLHPTSSRGIFTVENQEAHSQQGKLNLEQNSRELESQTEKYKQSLGLGLPALGIHETQQSSGSRLSPRRLPPLLTYLEDLSSLEVEKASNKRRKLNQAPGSQIGKKEEEHSSTQMQPCPGNRGLDSDATEEDRLWDAYIADDEANNRPAMNVPVTAQTCHSLQYSSRLFWLPASQGSEAMRKVPSKIRMQIYRHLLVPTKGFCLDPIYRRVESRVHMNILQACRIIHSEASSLMFQEILLIVFTEDIYHLEVDFSRHPLDPKLDMPRRPIWRYNPLGWNGGGYSSSPLDGFMDPHIFANFQRIRFFMTAWDYESREVFICDAPRADSVLMYKSSQTREDFWEFRATVNIPRILARILRKSPKITQLDLAINLKGLPLQAINGTTPRKWHIDKILHARQLSRDFCLYPRLAPLLELTNVVTFQPCMQIFLGSKLIRRGICDTVMEMLLIAKTKVEWQWEDPIREKADLVSAETMRLLEMQNRAFGQFSMPFRWVQLSPSKEGLGDFGKNKVERKHRICLPEILAGGDVDELAGWEKTTRAAPISTAPSLHAPE